jgi:tRNA A-37 threonylcarbamoyl transferase component Bud32
MVPRLPKGLTHPVNIGSGAFASVYRARQTGIDRWVAIKIIHEKDHRLRRELLQEARVQAQINLSCIPRVHDAFGWGSNVCIIMEWIKGIPLSTLLNESLDIEERLTLAGRFVEAVARLHVLGFAHRDIKPANVLVTPECSLYLVDFGFTRNITDGRASMSFVAKGTPAYMAPEVWERGARIDLIRADVYSAGKVLYEILDEAVESDVVKKCLQAHPDHRLASGAEILDAWRSSPHARPTERECRVVAAGNLASELLAERLVLSAKHLLYARRNDEAYWLLVEALEENPENGEAVRLMADFSRFSRTQNFNIRLRWAALAAAVIVISFAAFFAGRKSGSDVPPILSTMHPAAGQRIDARPVPHRTAMERGAIAFKEHPAKSGSLAGRIVLADIPGNGSIYVDGSKIDSPTIATIGIKLFYGIHILSWHDKDNVSRWKERVHLLPFETKRIPVVTINR